MTTKKLCFVFGISFFVVVMAQEFFHHSLPVIWFLTVNDAIDFALPFVLFPMMLGMFLKNAKPTRNEALGFLFATLCWVEGHGIHLTANAAGHLLRGDESEGLQKFTYFMDEVFGHYVYHVGVLSMSSVQLVKSFREREGNAQSNLVWEGIGAAFYGFIYFTGAIEGQTTPLLLPYAIAVVAFGLTRRGRTALRNKPVFAFYTLAHVLSVVMILGWIIYWRGVPQFSDLKWIV